MARTLAALASPPGAHAIGHEHRGRPLGPQGARSQRRRNTRWRGCSRGGASRPTANTRFGTAALAPYTWAELWRDVPGQQVGSTGLGRATRAEPRQHGSTAARVYYQARAGPGAWASPPLRSGHASGQALRYTGALRTGSDGHAPGPLRAPLRSAAQRPAGITKQQAACTSPLGSGHVGPPAWSHTCLESQAGTSNVPVGHRGHRHRQPAALSVAPVACRILTAAGRVRCGSLAAPERSRPPQPACQGSTAQPPLSPAVRNFGP